MFLCRSVCGWLICSAVAFAVEANHPDIAFLTSAQAKAAIVDESVEPYFSLLQSQEMASKTGAVITGQGLAAQRDACRSRYQAAVHEFSAAEQAGITAAITQVYPLLAKQYPQFAAEPWRFIKLDPAFEGGMPHTRGHCIIMSDMVMPMFARAAAGAPNPAGVNLLVHEQTHVVQRLHPKPFALLYTSFWNFVQMPHAPTPEGDLITHQLVNPDGIACVWAFPVTKNGVTTLVQPEVIYGSDQPVPSMPGDFNVIALSVEKHGDEYTYVRGADGKPQSVALEDVSEYGRIFAPSDENFHPNEICAELFSRMVTLDLLGRKATDSPCVAKLRAWAREGLAAK